MTPHFALGQRVRVRRRVTGRQYPCATVEAPIVDKRIRHWQWYAIETPRGRRWYGAEQLEAV